MERVEVVYGLMRVERVRRFLVRPFLWERRSPKVLNPKEKGTDVALATLLVMHACRRVFDKAIVISNDSDLALPVRTAVDLGGDVLVVHPSEYPAKALLRAGARVEKLWTSTVLS